MDESTSRNALSSLAGTRALVTGAAGFIGSHLCAELVEAGAEVHAVVRREFSEPVKNVRVHQLDLGDSQKTRGLFREIKPDFVFNMAGYVFGSRNVEHVQLALMGNLMPTLNLLIAATELGCKRVILAGSLEEPDADEVTAAKCVPTSPYAASKFAASCYARMFHELYQLPVTIARIFMTYGPRQRDLKKLVPYTILSLLKGRVPQLGSGSRPMDWIYVEDVVEGIVLLALADGVDGLTVDLGSGILYTGRQAVELIADLFGTRVTPVFGVVADRKLEVIRKANIVATKEALSWSAKVSFREGLERTIEWYRQQTETGSARLA